ncbi:hypothetical protein [Streptomyces clavifer]|uniref:hypothetical protein n=1 Tax=Streptomyces clavifer TaxID=68188 RepID=UPI0033A49C8E
MSHPQSRDRRGNEIKVGAIVTYADRDEMHGGIVAYIAQEKGLCELAIEDPKRGLAIRYGESNGVVIVYDGLIVQQP